MVFEKIIALFLKILHNFQIQPEIIVFVRNVGLQLPKCSQ